MTDDAIRDPSTGALAAPVAAGPGRQIEPIDAVAIDTDIVGDVGRGDEPAARRCLSAVRGKMADGMAQLLATAVESYCRLATLCPKPTSVTDATIKDFGAHHAACRSALAHIDRLIRIQQWAAAATERENGIPDSTALLARARKILDDYPPEDE